MLNIEIFLAKISIAFFREPKSLHIGYVTVSAVKVFVGILASYQMKKAKTLGEIISKPKPLVYHIDTDIKIDVGKEVSKKKGWQIAPKVGNHVKIAMSPLPAPYTIS